MQDISSFPARGKVIEMTGLTAVFQPTGTSYRLHLELPQGSPAPTDTPLDAVIRVRARKVWTVPSGGLFIAPIFGPPRTIQGRIRYLDERRMVINAGTNILVELPDAESALDLNSGPLTVGRMVNVVALPGAMMELPEAAAPVAGVSAGA